MSVTATVASFGNSAEMLQGLLLDGQWQVNELIINTNPSFSGGNFSKGYRVTDIKTGKIAFLKALDYSRAFLSPDILRDMAILVNASQFEIQILDDCKRMRLDRVVTPIHRGQVHPAGGYYPVTYIIFDMADGDIRNVLSFTRNLDIAWILRSIHHTAVGLSQMHRHNMSHQDLKPSNILVFDGNESKISDLGRSVIKGVPAPHENCDIAGDPSYAPPELKYGYIDPDWSVRRLGCDFYLLGSHILFLFTGTSMTSSIQAELDPQHYRHNWSGTYHEVLPYLRVAFEKVLESFSRKVDEPFKTELVELVRQLSDPDIELRGLARGKIKRGNQFDLQRYISRFNYLATKAELKLRR